MIASTKIAGIRSKETLEQTIEEEQLKVNKIDRLAEGMSCGIDSKFFEEVNGSYLW
ncbi:hypothetical protein [Bacillus sp. S3]|uniref:hypothetical protein n=1 Tax=Bacillus sp. S3 TaxID=486398 RepID=UPI0016809864|nr:hypothetical protein [Bacillus sp. S3]